jgi:hypothetical protein
MATLKRSGATRARSGAKTPRTARPGETERSHRARMDRIAAEQRASKRSVAQHSEHPERPGDSTVRHAEPQTGKQHGEGAGGFPQGEYDVTAPATEGTAAPSSAKSSHEQLVDAHLSTITHTDLDTLEGLLGDDRRLDDSELPLILEALPIGAIVEHEGLNRWRVRSPASGGIRWGHGHTAVHAIEAYVLGDTVSSADAAGAQRFLRLPKSQQKEIQERDRIAAERVGGTPDIFARDEAIRAANADATADAPAANAVTDGPEKASARAKQGSKRSSSRSAKRGRGKK